MPLHSYRLPISLPLMFLLVFLFAVPVGCGGGAGAEPFVETSPPPSGTPGGTPTPSPTPPPASAWDADAFSYGRTALFGSFPSALTRHGSTLFVSDADQVEAGGATILPIDISGDVPVASTTFDPVVISAAALQDDNGDPGDLTTPIGFGFFVNELRIASDTLGFVLANAGGSDSLPTLSNLIAFNPSNGTLYQVVNLANLYAPGAAIFDSAGAPIPTGTFVQSGAEGVEYVSTSATTGLLYVSMSNLVFGAPSYGAVKYPGTIQVFAVDTNAATLVSPTSDPVHVTRTFRTTAYNPVAIQRLGDRVLITCAGTTAYDANFDLVPVTNSTVEAYDAFTGAFQGQFLLGMAGLSAIRPAIGRDAAGHLVGFYPSSVTGEIYLIRLDGFDGLFIDVSKLGVLRGPGTGIPITAAQSGQPGGNITGVALSPDGTTLAVSGFGDLFTGQPGRVFLLGLPDDVVTGSGFGATFVPGSTEFASVAGRTTGEIVLVPGGGSGPDVFVNVGGAVDGGTGLGTSAASLGTLDSGGLIK